MDTITSPTVEEVAGRLIGAYNGAAATLMISLGHRTGLFDALAETGPATSEALADASGLTERYVREWLSALTTAGIVDYDADERAFSLSEAHAALLTRAAGPANMAVTAQYVPVIAGVEDDLVECFRAGGGVPYARFGRFHEVMAERSAQTVVAALDEHILALVPGLVDRLEEGIDVVDLGCGRGLALVHLATRYPRSRFVGYDLGADTIAHASAAGDGLPNLTFAVRDLTTLARDAEPAAFDLALTFDAVHDQADPLALLRGIRRLLRADGVYLMQDIAGSSHLHENLRHPLAPLLYAVSCMHCTTVSIAQGGEGLGTMWGEQQARRLLAEAGFATVEANHLDHDAVNVYFVVTP